MGFDGLGWRKLDGVSPKGVPEARQHRHFSGTATTRSGDCLPEATALRGVAGSLA